jgi:hypothetical protein
MKKVLILLMLVGLMGCQKEFPEPTDYTLDIKADLDVNWRVDLPEGEAVLFVFSQENQVIYITKDDQNMHSYVLESTGVINQKHSYNVTDLEYIESYIDHKLLSNWIQIKSHTHNIFLNPISGKMKEIFEDHQYTSGPKKVEYKLGENNVCYHLEYTSQNDVVCKVWDLESNEISTLDTLEKSIPANENSSFVFLGENSHLHYRNNLSQHLIYLKMKYERGLDHYACSLVGVSYSDFLGSEVWNSEVLFRTIHYDHETKPFVWDKEEGIFLTAGNTLYCIDPMQHEVKWERALPEPMDCNILLDDRKLYFVLQGEKAYCLDANTGSTVWSAGFGYVPTKIDIDEGILAISALRRLESEELFTDAFNTLHLIDARTGRELYRDFDPLQKGYNVPNDYRYGLTRSVVFQNNQLYLADQEQMLSFTIKKTE